MAASLRGALGEHLLDNRRALHQHAHILGAHQLDLFLAQTELDETTTLRGDLLRLAGGRLARTNVRFLAECTTCTHFLLSFLTFKKLVARKGIEPLTLGL